MAECDPSGLPKRDVRRRATAIVGSVDRSCVAEEGMARAAAMPGSRFRGMGIAGTTTPLWWKRSCQGTAESLWSGRWFRAKQQSDVLRKQ